MSSSRGSGADARPRDGGRAPDRAEAGRAGGSGVVRRVAVVQARTTSTRLPGKVLADLDGAPLVSRVLERLEQCRELDEVVLAVTDRADDDRLVELVEARGTAWFRGSEDDVLARYLGAARQAGADLVVRVTSDCPLVDPEEVDAVVRALIERRSSCDYASNRLRPQLPRGLDVEALWFDVLERTARSATSRAAREHVTWYCYAERPDLFRLHHVERPHDDADLRWTVDTADDLELVRRLYADLDLAHRRVPLADVVAHVRSHPDLMRINAHVQQKDPRA